MLSATSRLLKPTLKPALRGFASSALANKEIKRMTVFGAGLMGAGIVQIAAQGGVKVVMTDVSDAALDNGRKIINKSLTRIARKAHPDSEADQKALIAKVFDQIETTTSGEAAVRETDLVVEAIVENLETKIKLFGHLDGLAPKGAIFASNTSSLSIAAIASGCTDERKPLFAGFHAFNPVPAMKLVEVVSVEGVTTDETTEALLSLCKAMGKTPVRCKDTPGFIVNRLLVPYLLEAVRMVERGDASAKDIDTAMKLGAGLPMGPLELSDFVGLDTLSAIARGWRESRVESGEIDGTAVAPVGILEKLVGEGKLGRKSGEGFFKYD